MGAILADDTSMGFERMAESSRGLTIHELGRAIDERVRPETDAAAIAAIVDAQHAHPLSAIWGPGETSSSDGQFFSAGGWGEAGADHNARHGAEPGSVFYGFISDRFASFYSKVIPAAASEAPHVLDGLMHNEAALAIQEHATDTAGAVEAVFALFHLLGFRFAPRASATSPIGDCSPSTAAAPTACSTQDRGPREHEHHRGELGGGPAPGRLDPGRHRPALAGPRRRVGP